MAKSSASYQRRNAKARALGYRNYYDYRIHGAGKIPPGEDVPSDLRDIQRGHRSLQDLVNLLHSGRVSAITPTGGIRDESGKYETIHFTITTKDGRTKTYRLTDRQLTQNNLKMIRDIIEQQDIDYLPNPSIDVFGRHFINGSEEEEAA